MSVKKLRFTKDARAQIKNIGRYTGDRWGVEQKKLYLAKLGAGLDKIRAKPGLGKSREELYPGLLSYRIEHYYVYYYDLLHEILVIGIHHTKMDPRLHL